MASSAAKSAANSAANPAQPNRFFGTEIEYGISSPDNPDVSPILTSTQAVLAFAHEQEEGPVSYTHLTLPTNREV